ncbi:MAG: hypothetical protein HYS07_07395 [Chlamydiae bacterium]|nr:hypothetical protein [Chlamydiota bacterium]MBI3276659.1 hypothetical protein [Chlamydiota bacterium]
MELDSKAIRDLFQEVKKESRKQGMIYEESDGKTRVIPLMIRPRLIRPHQRDYFLKVCYHMNQAYQKLIQLYFSHPKIQTLFPFTPEEKKWLNDYFPKNPKAPHTLITRWDANTNFSGRQWKASFHFLEVNGVGVGGLHYTPTAERIILEVVLGALRKRGHSLKIRPNDDVRQILLWELQSHLKSLGQKRCHIGLVLDDRTKGGPLDFFFLAKFFQSQGIQAIVVDPRDLRLKKGQIMAKDLPLDILYRDSMIEELIEMEKEEKKTLSAMRQAFLENRVVSGLGGELDHKSAFEIFTSPFYERYFTFEERKCFRKHVLWTRLIRETKTTDPQGSSIDLLRYALQHQESLVLKPNRGYGGAGILMGKEAPQKKWEHMLQEALKQTGSYIIQERCAVRKKKFPVLDEKKRIVEKNLNVVCGFIYSPYGLGILGRASQANIVNVAQQGGMTTILICENSKIP